MVDPTSAALAAGAKAATDDATRRLVSKALDHLKVKLTDCFTSHLISSEAKCRSIKNIMYRDEAVDLYSQYVPVRFSGHKIKSSDYDIVELVKKGSRILISGKAGFGKTIFMKWATLELIKNREYHQRYPIFLELREFAEAESKKSIKSFIFEKTSVELGKSSFEQFEIGLKNGLFILILDAVDEISHVYRGIFTTELRDLLRQYPLCPALISTRPDESIEALAELSVYRSLPMERQQIINVIENLDYVQHTKERLVDDIRGSLFDKHRSFLSNPLLATIMLLTYDHNAEIPTKITSFYKQAFEALYQRHDIHKGGFGRAHIAGLPMDEFELIFSIFCYRSFIEDKYEFSDSELAVLFRESVKFSSISVDPIKVIKDSIESASLLQKEGLDNSFVHRSFQEYFTALFISNYRGPEPNILIDKASHGSGALKMLLEIKPDLLEYEWILPKANNWLQKVINLNLSDPKELKLFFYTLWNNFDWNPSSGTVTSYSIADDMDSNWMSAIAQLYPGFVFTNSLFQKNLARFSEVLPIIEEEDESKYPMFLNLKNYVVKYIGDRNSMSYRIVPEDAEWLHKTNFVWTCSDIRKQVAKTVHRIEERKAKATSLVKQLVTLRSE